MAGLTPIGRTGLVSIFAAGVLALAACGSDSTGPVEEPDGTGGGGGASPGTGGGTTNPDGGKAGGTTGSGGKTTGSGGGTTGSGGGTTGSGGGPVVGPCTPGTTPLAFDNIGTNNASWAGSGAPDTVVVNGNYLPMSTSDCPLDADMAGALAYKDKIFNGCLDECGDGNNAGHGKATLIDWSHTTGWTTAQIASNLHWTGMWEPSTGTKPTTLVFWIKGALGCENEKITLAIHIHDTTMSASVKLPVNVSQEWQRVVIPWTSFKIPSTSYPDAMTFTPSGTGKATFLIDQAYLSKTVSP